MLQTRLACSLALFLVPVQTFSSNLLPGSRALNFGASSANSPPVYVSAFLESQLIRISGSEFNVPVLGVAAGWWGWPGIGLEFELGTGLGDDSLNNLDLEVASYASVNVRLESPPIDQIAAYAVFGLSRTNFETEFSGFSSSADNALEGLRGAFGFTYRLTPQFVLDTAYSHQAYDDDISINSFRFGVRYDFFDGGR